MAEKPVVKWMENAMDDLHLQLIKKIMPKHAKRQQSHRLDRSAPSRLAKLVVYFVFIKPATIPDGK